MAPDEVDRAFDRDWVSRVGHPPTPDDMERFQRELAEWRRRHRHGLDPAPPLGQTPSS